MITEEPQTTIQEITGTEPVAENKEDFKAAVEATFTEEEKAAGKFAYLLPFVKKNGGKMSAKGITRVLYQLALFPFGDTLDVNKMGFQSKQEKELFQLMFEISSAKGPMLEYVKNKEKEKKNEHAE